ncbi:MAG: DUF2933 domain-containing protein [Candidatus Sericytochromatia bacterium]|nr:DUF2933 domain-containing protein [Candidatus Tanganyikabacteria bacterium]
MQGNRPAERGSTSRLIVGFAVFAAIAGFLLATEHRAHVLGALPFALLFLCPLMHLFMHRADHGGGAHDGGRREGRQ